MDGHARGTDDNACESGLVANDDLLDGLLERACAIGKVMQKVGEIGHAVLRVEVTAALPSIEQALQVGDHELLFAGLAFAVCSCRDALKKSACHDATFPARASPSRMRCPENAFNACASMA